MKITLDTAGKGFFARLGDLILDKIDGSKREALGALTHAIPAVVGRLSEARQPEADIDGFYDAWIAHCEAGFERSQAEADKLAELFGVKAPSLAKKAAS